MANGLIPVRDGAILPAMPSGPKSTFDQSVADVICDELQKGRTLRAVCRDPGMPTESTVRLWAVSDAGPGFATQYDHARRIGYLAIGDEIVEISDDGSNDWMERQRRDGTIDEVVNREAIERSKLRVDTRKWVLSRMLPKVYGDKLQHTGAGGDGPVEVAVIRFSDLPAIEDKSEK